MPLIKQNLYQGTFKLLYETLIFNLITNGGTFELRFFKAEYKILTRQSLISWGLNPKKKWNKGQIILELNSFSLEQGGKQGQILSFSQCIIQWWEQGFRSPFAALP